MVSRKMKMLPTIRIPYATVHTMMSRQGFKEREDAAGAVYETTLNDPATGERFQLRVPIHRHEDSRCEVDLTAAKVEQAERVPDYVQEAALSKLMEMADYFRSMGKLEEAQ